MDKEIKEPWGKQFSANKGGTDEWYTPREAVEVIAKYIPNGSRILCPFDKAESEYVKVLSRNNNVIYSHIEDGVDFFKLEKPDVDYIISNPPYSLRNEILKKLFSWEIPFALLLNTNGLFDSATRFRIAKKIEGGYRYVSFIRECNIRMTKLTSLVLHHLRAVTWGIRYSTGIYCLST